MVQNVFRIFISILFLLLSGIGGIYARSGDHINSPDLANDTITDRQILYNGRIWRNRYGQVLNHEFFLTKSWIPGEVTVNRKNFRNVMLRYDLFNNDLLLMVNPGTVIILSSEKVASFTLNYESEVYRFINYNFADSSLFSGYGHLLYSGKASLIIKYNKQIKLLAVENKFDEFYQKQQVFILKDGRFNRLKSKKDLFNLLSDNSDEIRKQLKDKRFTVSISKPETVIPVLLFYDSLIQSR
jgi:hypothetical protein